MNFYGVGVKFDGTDDMLPIFLEKNFWVMGHNESDKEKMAKTISEIRIGDILFAKAYANIAQHTFPIRAIGIVTDTNLPVNIPEEYKGKSGVSVIWIKHFERNVHLLAKEYRRGAFHTATVFKESNDDMIYAIKQMMKYDYINKSEDDKKDNTAFAISNSEYIKIAKSFIFDEAYSTYEEEEIIEYPDEEIEIVAEDSYGRKIIRIPFEAEEIETYGLILLVPEKDWSDDSICLANISTEFTDNENDILTIIEKMKNRTDWDKTLKL